MSVGYLDVDSDVAATRAGEMRAWLSSGDLQSGNGAYCAWVDEATDLPAFEYPEITGYALTWLAGRGEASEAEAQAGGAAAAWLCRRISRGDRSARSGWDGGAIYTFDLGMIAAGLLSYGHITRDEQLTSVGSALASELARYVCSTEGLRAIAPDGPRTDRPSQWSTTGGAHLVKCVQALLLANKNSAAGALVESTAACIDLSGCLRTQPDATLVMLHPHLYAVEGLWMWAMESGDGEALGLARLATEWAWTKQLESGGLPRYASQNAGCGPEQCDVTAQAIRAAILTGADTPGIAKAVDRLVSLTRSPSPGNAGLVYQPARKPHLNSWATMFGAQALELVATPAAELDWRGLV